MKMFRFYDENTNVSGLVSAETASKARYLVKLEANEAGFESEFGDISIHRVSEYDESANKPRLLSTIECESLEVEGHRFDEPAHHEVWK